MVEIARDDAAFLVSILRGVPIQGSIDGGIVATALRIQGLIAKLSDVSLDGDKGNAGDVGVDVGSLTHSKEV